MTLRLLIPVDERIGSVRTANYIIRMKDILKPVVNLLTVYDTSILEGHGLVEEFQEKITAVAKQKSEKILSEYKEKFEKEGILVENAYVKHGSAGDTICEETEKLNVDMVVMSPNNQSEFTNVIVGSVTHYVIHHSATPLLLVK